MADLTPPRCDPASVTPPRTANDMGKSLEKIGLIDNDRNNNLIISHLLDTGNGVNSGNRLWLPSVLEGPQGTLKVKSTWKILEDNRVYLNTIMLVPIK